MMRPGKFINLLKAGSQESGPGLRGFKPGLSLWHRMALLCVALFSSAPRMQQVLRKHRHKPLLLPSLKPLFPPPSGCTWFRTHSLRPHLCSPLQGSPAPGSDSYPAAAFHSPLTFLGVADMVGDGGTGRREWKLSRSGQNVSCAR